MRLRHFLCLAPLFAVAPTANAAPPSFPIIVDGGYCTEPNCTPPSDFYVPYRWILYADGTYDEGTPGTTFPDYFNTGDDGTWSFAGGVVTILATGAAWAYQGTVAAGNCVERTTGRWAFAPLVPPADGKWYGCEA